ncbi:MAG: hypothetical protein H6739_27730 [Alphaproteobacteria bacterium]|nr:hypothetical protein [Alphaproteobacteria bacterium]
MLLSTLLLASGPAWAWGHHYLVTDRALDHASVDYADEAVVVEPIEALLLDLGPELTALFDGYYDWLEARGRGRFNRVPYDDSGTREAFLRAARLNPDEASLPLVYRVPPGGASLGTPMDCVEASPYLAQVEPPLRCDIEHLEPGQSVPARAVLTTYADEPDWGLDHHLWGYTEFGYGEQPYGKPEGESSKAPFHMQFAHENFLVRAAAPEALDGMVVERMELFFRLSRLSFDAGHDYWGYRFAAWAIHYAQDIAQPYHAKAVPSATVFYYLRYAISPNKDRLKATASQLSGNRHFLYEDFVAYGLQSSYEGSDPLTDALAEFLGSGDALWAGVSDMDGLAAAVMDASAHHARRIDKTIVKAFGAKYTEDPDYDVETAPDYSVTAAIEGMDEAKGELLLSETAEDFHRAGCATRTIIDLARK